MIHKIVHNTLNEYMEAKAIFDGECPKSGCVKEIDGKWRVISNKTGKLWDAHYDSEEEANNAIQAYHSNVK